VGTPSGQRGMTTPWAKAADLRSVARSATKMGRERGITLKAKPANDLLATMYFLPAPPRGSASVAPAHQAPKPQAEAQHASVKAGQPDLSPACSPRPSRPAAMHALQESIALIA
jgi:hypothetical protein